MPSTRLVLLLAALLLPSLAGALAWQGVEPGKTSADEVVRKVGEPTSRVKKDGQTVLIYKGDQALTNTKLAQFFCRGDGVVEEIQVFLDAALDGESIEGTYGKPQAKTFTDKFQKVWQYPQKGVAVYFDKAGAVETIVFGAPRAEKARPKAEPKADAAAAPPEGGK